MEANPLRFDRPVASRHELEGWRVVCGRNPLAYPSLDFHTDLAPAFAYGVYARQSWRDAVWNADLEAELGEEWRLHRGGSRLPWLLACAFVRHGFEGFRGPRAKLAGPDPPYREAGRLSLWIDGLVRRLAASLSQRLVR